MSELLQVLVELVHNLIRLMVILAQLVIQYGLIVSWWAWWLLLVDWREFWPALRRGAWMPLVLGLGFVSYLAWLLAVPFPGAAALGPLTPVVTCLVLLASVLVCGWLQTILGWYPVEISIELPESHPAHELDEHGHADLEAHENDHPPIHSPYGAHD